MSTEIKTADLKKPKRFLMKFLNGLVAGAGGFSQEMVTGKFKAIFPAMPAEVPDAIEWLAAALVQGAVDQEQIEALAAGFGAGAAKDLFKDLLNRFNLMPKAPAAGLPQGSSSNPVIPPSTSGGGFFI